jgi:DNA-binding MarR family transcriptional regulator
MNGKKYSELSSLFFSMRQIVKQQLPNKGKTDPNAWLRLETMRFIGMSKNPTMHDVARHLRVKAPSATSLVAHLAASGFVVRTGEATDKRIVRISLTSSGKQEVAAYLVRSETAMRKAFSKLHERDVSELVRILRDLQNAHNSRS